MRAFFHVVILYCLTWISVSLDTKDAAIYNDLREVAILALNAMPESSQAILPEGIKVAEDLFADSKEGLQGKIDYATLFLQKVWEEVEDTKMKYEIEFAYVFGRLDDWKLRAENLKNQVDVADTEEKYQDAKTNFEAEVKSIFSEGAADFLSPDQEGMIPATINPEAAVEYMIHHIGYVPVDWLPPPPGDMNGIWPNAPANMDEPAPA